LRTTSAWEIYETWGKRLDADPFVQAIFNPTAEIQNTSLCPPVDLVHPIQIEANSIIFHYALFTAVDFVGVILSAIPAPLAAVILPVQVHHAKIALSAIMAAIQNPPNTYATIHALQASSYMSVMFNKRELMLWLSCPYAKCSVGTQCPK
jgi:hypothetical protein